MSTEMSGVLLAGGKSSRFGTDKALAKLENKALIQRAVDLLKSVFTDVYVIVNPKDDYSFLDGINIYNDLIPNCGPMGGIYTALKKSESKYNFVMACDMPALNQQFLNLILAQPRDYDVLVPIWQGRKEPLVAVYKKNCLTVVKENLERKNFKLTNIFHNVKVRYLAEDKIRANVIEPEYLFYNVNYKKDLAKIKETLAKKGEVVMGEELLDLVHPDKIKELYLEKLDFKLKKEKIALAEAKGRVAASDIKSTIDLPPFTRSSMDGYALKAEDTYRASENNACYLDLTAKVAMGEEANIKVESGSAVEINTGGMLPESADAVVMVEYTNEVSKGLIEIKEAVAPGENVIQQGEDIAQGELLVSKGTRLKPQHIAALAGVGITELEVFIPPKASIFSTGDELVEPDKEPQLGQIRDVNSYSISALANGLINNSKPKIIKDDKASLKQAINRGIKESDLVILSGGSSVGTKDLTIDVIEELGEAGVLVHGVAIKPGKPTILAIVDDTIIIGLPGHPTAAMVVFKILVKPLLRLMNGIDIEDNYLKVPAFLSRNVPSDKGRREYIRVELEDDKEQDRLIAHPITGKSGLIKTMLKADGLVEVDIGKEGVAKDSCVEVLLLE